MILAPFHIQKNSESIRPFCRKNPTLVNNLNMSIMHKKYKKHEVHIEKVESINENLSKKLKLKELFFEFSKILH